MLNDAGSTQQEGGKEPAIQGTPQNPMRATAGAVLLRFFRDIDSLAETVPPAMSAIAVASKVARENKMCFWRSED